MRRGILAFVLGVWLLQQMSNLPEPWYAVWVFLCLPAWYRLARYSRWLRQGFFLTAACGAGFFWAATLAHLRLADALPAEWEGRDVELVGVVATLPQRHERGERFLFDVERVRTPGAIVPQRISLTRYFAAPDAASQPRPGGGMHPGERWRLTVRLKQPHGTYNPHGFDFEAWTLERSIRATGYLRDVPAAHRIDPFVPRPSYVVEHLREGLRDRFHRVLGESRYAGVLVALAIGDDDAISVADWDVLLRTGTNHLMSISGLHVTMVASLGYAMLHLLWRRMPFLTLRCPARRAAALAGLVTACGYALLAGFAVPTQRTLYMLAVIAFALWQGRAVAVSLVLCWALFVVVLIDPWAVLAPGFWLSFGAVALLVYAGNARLDQSHWLEEAARAQWAVTLGLAPMLLALFQQASVISPLANAWAIPLVSLVVTPLTLVGAVLPVDALLWMAHETMAYCMMALTWMAGFAQAVWEQHAPPAWSLPLAMLGVAWLMLPRGFPMRWLGVLALLPLILLKPEPLAPASLRLIVLDVGQGTAVVARTARHVLLYDAGPRFSADADSGTRIILPYLRGEGLDALDGMVISHDDNDHAGGARSVLTALPPAWLLSGLPPGHPLQTLYPGMGPCRAGQHWQWDGVRFEMLYPGEDDGSGLRESDNNRSCVLKITTPHGSVLLPGDIESPAERRLLERLPGQLAADVLIVPHHGSLTSSTPDFISAVNPRHAVFTAGYRNRFRHPRPQVMHRYQAQGSALLRSDRDGALLFQFSGNTVQMRSWRAERQRYWHHRVAENGAAG